MKSLAAEERLDWLRTELLAAGSVELAAASEALGVSEMTVRRDLRMLEEAGEARRVRGGAVAPGPRTFQSRELTRSAQKRQIALKAAALVPPRGVIAVDSSSTMHRLASRLGAAEQLRALANALPIYEALAEHPGVTPILLGGTLDRRSGSFVGPVTERFLEEVHIDLYFMSTAALDHTGCQEDTWEEASLKRRIAQAADRVVVGADSAKLGIRAEARSVPLADVDILITELDPDAEEVAELANVIPTVL
ncbi:DeoR/GlpR family DNA-binding transcription regulator [Zhihengliuella alba]|uniref:DeoR/GlpR family DNA-binding transcription regulator n=1 Tax=Zhihengliuella alba TaxID=547018 RepID=A0ABP7E3F4_9MICC